MGMNLLVVGVSVSLAAALAGFLFSGKPGINDDLEQAGIDDIQITHAKEGTVISWVYGKVKLAGNIIWWGNLRSREVKEDSGGKGGGGGDVTTGYIYFIDCWQAICQGPVTLEEIYVNDKKVDEIDADEVVFNDGTTGNIPDINEDNINSIPGIAWVYIKKWKLGLNVTSPPTIHFVVKKVLPSTINNSNMDNGNNPAAIVYDVLHQAGVNEIDISLTKFNIAADYYFEKSYGLNLIFNSEKLASEWISDILNYVDGIFGLDENNKYFLDPMDPTDTPEKTLNTEDFIDFQLYRPTYAKLYNSFKATFTDKTKDYTQRSITIYNPAAIQIAGFRNNFSFNLSPFSTNTIASKRLHEIAKKNSYPPLETDFTTFLWNSDLLPGKVIEINNTDFNMSSFDFRVTSVDLSEINSNKIKCHAIQMTETLFDDYYINGGGSEWEQDEYTLEPLSNAKIFELPYTKKYQKNPAFLVLAAREKGIESGFVALISNNNTDYTIKAQLGTFCQHGTLQEEYTADTYNIDDKIGLLYRPTLFDPEFTNISRAELFSIYRVAIVGNEIMGFQNIVPEGLEDYRLTGVFRGAKGTPKETHANGSEIFLCEIGNNIITDIDLSSFYLKLIPVFLGSQLDPTDATAIPVNVTGIAAEPRKPARLKATRTGANIYLEIWPNSPGVAGCGAGNPENIVSSAPHPFDHEGDFIIEYDAVRVAVNNTEYNFSRAGDVLVKVSSRILGKITSNTRDISVLAADGEYISWG